jgi:trimeric autotransporter adhesin
MKNLFAYIFIVAALFITIEKTTAQSANTSLSNLVKTKINQSLFPKTTNTYNLGADDSAWKNLFLTGSIYLDNKRFISNQGTYNNFFGTNAGKSTTGLYNTAIGYYSMYSNTTGYYNTSNGYFALFANTTGYYNTANGAYALNSNTSGDYNTAAGYISMLNNTTGIDNSSYGAYSLSYNTTGFNNTAIGRDALYNNTIGNNNVAVGLDALYYNKTGVQNTAVGNFALNYNNENYNTAIGYYALRGTTASEYNTAVGYNAGDSYDNGYNNVFVGANTDVNGAGYYNVIAIGQGTVCTDVNQARFGNSSTASIGGWANWTNVSDGRVKKNIKQNVPGLAFINKLQPITYNLDLDAADKIIQHVRKDSTGKIIPLSQKEIEARVAKEKILYTGFVAQDVEKAAKNLNYDFSGVDAAKNDKSLYGLRYSDFVVPLVKAVQELSKMNNAKDSEINNLETRLSKLEAMMNVNQSTVNSQQSAVISSAALQQNIPNPFTNSTSISYSLPSSYSSAKIIITDNKGIVLKQINLTAKGKGNISVDAATLSSGAYQYTLYVDGKMIDTKQMISSK